MTPPNDPPASDLEAANAHLRDSLERVRAEHVQAQAALHEESRLLEILNQTGQSIASQLEIDKLLQTVTDAATELTGAKFGAFFYNRVDENGEDYLLYTLSGAPREAFDKFGHPRATRVFAPTFHGEAPVRSDDITQDPRYGSMGPHYGQPPGHLPVRSYLAVAVKSRSGEVHGGLFFGHPEAARFSERSERLVVGMAAQAAVAIDNARLYEAAQRELAKRERAETALRENDRRKDEFLATLAHELRNPLAPIRQAAIISSSPAASETQKAWAHDVITRQVQNMALLLEDLLDISRITRGTLELRKDRTTLARIVESAVETARPAIDAKRHHLEVRLPSEAFELEADPLRLSQVLSNLLTNAAKYTDPEGHIGLDAQVGEEGVMIRVRDDGIGISAEALPDIFAMFSQVASARSGGGLGIGLALSRGLVEMHGGTLSAGSHGLGKGSEFTVKLPLNRIAAAPRAAEPTNPVSNMRLRRVLVADDNLDAGESLAMLLRLDGHEVEVAHNGPEALALFDRMKPEIAILDIGMPGLTGYEVAQRIRAQKLSRPVTLIAVTGWGQDADKARAAESGFDHHFTKPIEPESLSALIGR
ncbi:MAG TPA: ATP-binding protein [Steroidobacteraceae bacterium]|nr:ATP-binding protein [Steroidobacteraceae bacterium]